MHYRALPIAMASEPAALCPRLPREYAPLSEASPAFDVLVDFSRESALTTDRHRQIGPALKDMARAGVRTLIVISNGNVVGLVTAYDIQGEKPVRFIQSSDCIHHPKCHHEDVEVGDIMTPLAELPTLSVGDFSSASVGNVRETFRQTGHSHLLVTEVVAEGQVCVRGLVSRAQIERQLGEPPSAADMQLIEREITRLFAS